MTSARVSEDADVGAAADVDVNSLALAESMAGASGAIVALLTSYPLLTINTRQQTSKRRSRIARADGEDAKEGDSLGTQSTISEARTIIKTSGVGGLYSGIKPALVGTICSNTVYFYLCGYLREAWIKRKGGKRLSAAESLLVASLAGCGNVLATNPIWIIVTRMQAHRKQVAQSADGADAEAPASSPAPHTAWDEVAKLHRENGLVGFWKGVVPSLVMVSNPAIQFMFFEWLQHKRADAKRSTQMTAGEVFGMSALAKLAATLITYPLLVVKSTVQNASKQAERERRAAASGAGSKQRSPILEVALHILKTEGAAGFYKGLGTKIFQSVFAASVMYMCKEEIKKTVFSIVLKDKARKIVAA